MTPGTSRYRLLSVDSRFSPFQGVGDGKDYGGSKHVMWTWHPELKRVYTFGGDFGRGAGAFGQPDMGATFHTLDPVNPRSYQRFGGFETDQYSINPYATGSVPWRLEHPYLPRNINGVRETRPGRIDQASLVWDSTRKKFWGIYTTIRDPYIYRLPDNNPDPWANGDIRSGGPSGTWSWVPNENGGAGVWKLETSARLIPGDAPTYTGDTLSTSLASERVAYFSYDPKSDRLFGFGQYGGIFIFNPHSMKYEYRTINIGNTYSYINMSSSQVAVVGDWIYGAAYVRQGGNKSQLIRLHVPSLLALSNGGSISTVNSQAFEAFQMPFSISDELRWENGNDGSVTWSEHCGVMNVDDRVAIVCSYDGLIDGGQTKLTVFNPSTKTFTPADPAPENIVGTSWVALPDTGEIMFGLNAGSYPNNKIWIYRVRD